MSKPETPVGGKGVQLPPEPVNSQPKQPAKAASPFKKPDRSSKRIKLFLWGDSGVGKTTLALKFPKPAVIDLEGGTRAYDSTFRFERLDSTSADDVMAAVNWLLASPHDYRTLIIDPISVYYEALQKKYSELFLKRNRGSKGYKHEFYEFQPNDWRTLKSELKELLRKLVMLDMNVIVTAREKDKYAEGEFMRRIGETFDAEGKMPYYFDIVCRLTRDENGVHKGFAIKDRTMKLPRGHFDPSFETFEGIFGHDEINRESRTVEFASEEQVAAIQALIHELKVPDEVVKHRLLSYDAETLTDLTKGNAQIILDKLEAARKGGSK